MPALKRRVVAMIGAAGSGKTYLAASMYGQEKRALIYNIANDAQFLAKSNQLVVGDEHSAKKSLPAIMRGRKSRSFWKRDSGEEQEFRVSFTPTDLDFDARTIYAPSFNEVCLQCWLTGRMTFYLDEAHLLLGSSTGSAPTEFRRLVFMGRHREISVVYMSHRTYNVPRPLTFNTNIFYFFQTGEPRDLNYIEEIAGYEVAEKVKNLRRLNLSTKPVVPGQVYEWNADLRVGKVIDL